MSKSHAVDWALDAPTPAQLSEFFRQVGCGRITKGTLQTFLARGARQPVNEISARRIMGRNCFGVEEALTCLGVSFSREQLTVLSQVPFSMETLEECKDTHVLVAIFGDLSILEIHARVSDKGCFSRQNLYISEKFAQAIGQTHWALIRKTPVPRSTNKTWDEQLKLLAQNDEVVSARIMTYATVGHFLATGERLFERICVRCLDANSFGNRVDVRFDLDGFDFSGSRDGYRSDGIGVASARKFD